LEVENGVVYTNATVLRVGSIGLAIW